jgi:hypothetical protein
MKESDLKMDRYNRPIQQLKLDINQLFGRYYRKMESVSENRICVGKSNLYRKIESASEDRLVGPFSTAGNI